MEETNPEKGKGKLTWGGQRYAFVCVPYEAVTVVKGHHNARGPQVKKSGKR